MSVKHNSECVYVILASGLATTSKEAFLFGGRASPKEPSDKIFRINLETREITEFQNCEVSGRKPCARWKHSLTSGWSF